MSNKKVKKRKKGKVRSKAVYLENKEKIKKLEQDLVKERMKAFLDFIEKSGKWVDGQYFLELQYNNYLEYEEDYKNGRIMQEGWIRILEGFVGYCGRFIPLIDFEKHKGN